jgi:diacylglycerol kinase family enzyme
MQATLRERLAIVGLSPIFADLEAPDLSEWIAKASADGCRAIVAAGGDGTISRVGQDLVDGTVPLGVIPLGTMNLFAKDIGVPTDDIDGAAATLAAGHIRRIDVGEVNGHYFLCGSILGLPARLAQYRRRGDTWWQSFLIWTRFLRAFLRALLRYRPLRANLFVAERTIRVRASSMIITPNKINDERGPVFGRGDLEGGRLAVYVFGRLHVADVVRLALRALFHRWQKDQRVTEYEVGRLGIVARSPGLRVMNDGETLILRPPLRYRLLPRALPVLCPPPKSEVPVSDVPL